MHDNYVRCNYSQKESIFKPESPSKQRYEERYEESYDYDEEEQEAQAEEADIYAKHRDNTCGSFY